MLPFFRVGRKQCVNVSTHQTQCSRNGKVNTELASRGELPRPGRGSEGRVDGKEVSLKSLSVRSYGKSAVVQEVISRVDFNTPAARAVAVIL